MEDSICQDQTIGIELTLPVVESNEQTEALHFAVIVTNAEYRYANNYSDIGTFLSDPFRKQPSISVLKKVSIAVTKGNIYALLGASGCGKTTLLRCILGRLQLKSGTIQLFGQKPGSASCSIPGAGVGYMPQQLALYPDFNITETLLYFGKLYQMSSNEIESQTVAIGNVLQLPSAKQLVRNLSGGQQRRVSLACALIHNPPLLILDEPTVGVDPLLRNAIWKHLEALCSQQGTTVLLTTHYVEETRTAKTIALMRNGSLLIEANPTELLAAHNLPRLEDVFLKLCMIQDNETDETKEEIAEKSDVMVIFSTATENDNINPTKCSQKSAKPLVMINLNRLKALFMKYTIGYRQNVLSSLFSCFFPAIVFSIFMITAGSTPRNLPVAIVNEEVPAELSAAFLSYLNLVHLMSMNSVDEAESAVANGTALAAVHFIANFSTAIENRRIEMMDADNDTVYASSIHLYLDMSKPIIGYSLLQQLFLAFQSMFQHFLWSLDCNTNSLSAPIAIAEVVYGTLNFSTIVELYAPGFLLFIAFFFAASSTGMTVIVERNDCLLERSLVAGVKPFECLLSHAFTQIIWFSIQQVLLFIASFYLLGQLSRGPVILVFLFIFLQGIAGVMYGLVVSSIISDKTNALIVLVGSIVPSMMLSGVFWPIQANSWLYLTSMILPQSNALQSIRSVLYRGWSIWHYDIIFGLASTSAWIIIFLLLATFLFNKFVYKYN